MYLTLANMIHALEEINLLTLRPLNFKGNFDKMIYDQPNNDPVLFCPSMGHKIIFFV